MNSAEIKKKVSEACEALYKTSFDLIVTKTHERTIAAKLANLLEDVFDGWDVDVEYNREGGEGRSKRSLEDELLLPDIIIHKRGSIIGPNLVVIQVKGFWNNENRAKDEKDLRKLRERFGYKKLYRLELNFESYELIEVD